MVFSWLQSVFSDCFSQHLINYIEALILLKMVNATISAES